MSDHRRTKLGIIGLSVGALGVVFGDIGTSPLYAINQIFFGRVHPTLDSKHILSLISLVIWSLLLVVAFKYVVLVLRADNEGEGGVFALYALLRKYRSQIVLAVCALLIIAAGLLFGDGIITPAISVLSAVEGLKVVEPSMASYVIPITIIILTGLFTVQSYGTHKIGRFFGPIILLWFFALAALGLRQVVDAPSILRAFNPEYAVEAFGLFSISKLLIILGSVMLVVTGGEALYADMGHFGRLPIRISWFSVVLPCLIINYLGQGAFLLSGHTVVGGNLFYSLVPQVLLVPMVILASMATVIASQALISGAFSLSSQGVALGLLPRLRIQHTHEHHEGQIYISFVNWALYAGCVLLVLTFRSSERLASAYGLAVSGVMVVTTLSMILVSRMLWRWSRVVALAVFVPLLCIDLLFLTANTMKFLEGGYIPLSIGLALFTIMSTWQWGKRHFRDTLDSYSTMTMSQVLKLKRNHPAELDRSLLVLTNQNPTHLQDKAPALLALFAERHHSLPKHVITLNISQRRRPYVDHDERYEIHQFENDHGRGTSLLAINARFGFLEEPNVEKVISDIAHNNELTPNDDMSEWMIYVARERVVARRRRFLTRMRAILYALLVSNCTPAYEYYGLSEDSRLNAVLLPVRIS